MKTITISERCGKERALILGAIEAFTIGLLNSTLSGMGRSLSLCCRFHLRALLFFLVFLSCIVCFRVRRSRIEYFGRVSLAGARSRSRVTPKAHLESRAREGPASIFAVCSRVTVCVETGRFRRLSDRVWVTTVEVWTLFALRFDPPLMRTRGCVRALQWLALLFHQSHLRGAFHKVTFRRFSVEAMLH